MHHIFVPGDKEMKFQYPELGRTQAFADLSDREMRFCWYFACKSSPLASIEENKRLRLSCDKVYGDERSFHVEAIKRGDFEDKMLTALSKMSSYSIYIRNKAYDIINTCFDNVEWATSVDSDMSDDLDSLLNSMEMDLDDEREYVNKGGYDIELDDDTSAIDDKNLYTELSTLANSIMPELVQLVEEGFGVNLKYPAEEESFKVYDDNDIRSRASRISYKTFDRMINNVSISESDKLVMSMKQRKKVVQISKNVVYSIVNSILSVERQFEKEIVKKTKEFKKGKLVDRILGNSEKYF